MKNQKMIEYLRNVVDLEKEKYLQERIINSMEYQIRSLGIPNQYSRPYLQHEHFESLGADGISTLLSVAFVAGFIGIFFLNPVKFALVGLAIDVALYVVLGGYAYIHDNRINRENYEREMQAYNQCVESDKNRVEVENREKEHLSVMLSQLRSNYQRTCALLERYYATDVIYPKYRNLVAMCSIYEYFDAGRCDAMEGHEGAYNIYGNEVLLGLILTKLDDISAKLDAIRQNQSVLYDAINHGNRLSEQLLQESRVQAKQLQFIESNTAIAAYCSAETAREANQIKWLQLYQMTR